MSRGRGPFVERRLIPDDLRDLRAASFSRPRRREYVWMAAFFSGLLYLCVVGPLDYEAERASAGMALEVGGGQAPAFGATDPFAGAGLDVPRASLLYPLTCQAPKAQWIRSWGDGRSPFERQEPGHRLPLQCVNADLRRSPHVKR